MSLGRKCVAVRLICALSCFLLTAMAVAADQSQTRTDAPVTAKPGKVDGETRPALTGERRPLYRLHKSDVIEIAFTYSPEFNQTATVQPDGFLSLKTVQAIYAEGMTLPQLTSALELAYSSTLHAPEINIVLKEFNKPYFVATGEVVRPGKYELRDETTITEALAMSGGFTGQAKHSQVILFRQVSEGVREAKLIDVKRMLNARNLREDSYLKPGDLLYVPQNRISKIKKYLPASVLGMYWNATQF